MGSRSRGDGNYRNPCLTMHQPWASLLVYGIKRIEGRSWPSPIRGIHLLFHSFSHCNKLYDLWYGFQTSSKHLQFEVVQFDCSNERDSGLWFFVVIFFCPVVLQVQSQLVYCLLFDCGFCSFFLFCYEIVSPLSGDWLHLWQVLRCVVKMCGCARTLQRSK